MKVSPKRRLICAVFFVLLVLSGYWIIIGKVQICMLRMITGFPCPGCGLTHAGIALLRGEWKASFAYHPLLIPTLFILLATLLRRHHPFDRLIRSRGLFLVIFFLYLALYVIRLAAYYPHGPYPMVYDHASLFGVLAGKVLPFFQ